MSLLAALGLLALAPLAPAQEPDLYDDTVLRTIDITLPQTNFWGTLRNTANTGVNLVVDLTLSGPDLPTPVTIPGVGIRVKGNSSFFFLPPGSQKTSFNIEITESDNGARLLGYRTLNLNNGIEDPTFCREIGFFRFVRRYTPAGQGNHVQLRLNGENWGVYVNVQQYNTQLLDEYFEESGGARYKAQNISTGQDALRYIGTNPNSYAQNYQLKDNGGLALPWQPMIDGTFALNNSGADVAAIDEKFAVDGAIWALVAENLFMDEDSYISKGADFNVYYDPLHDRINLHQHDGNESWGVSLFGWPGGTTTNLSPTYRFNAGSRPAVSRLMTIPRLRERYFAHYRTMLEDFSWADLQGDLLGYKALIDAAVLADPKRLYSYAQFQSNFNTQTFVNVGGSTLPCPGLEQYLVTRRNFLLNQPDLTKVQPQITELAHTPAAPTVGTPTFITARIQTPGSTVGFANLYYREIGRYIPVPMFDDGLNGDGAAGDGVFGAQLPIPGTAGGRLDYYVEAGAPLGVGGGQRYAPKFAEGKPAGFSYPFGSAGIRITEYMYSGNGDEFVELTNTSGAAIDLTGWSVDDSSANAGTFDLSAAGVVDPGESIVITEGAAASFQLDWGLTGVTVLEGNVNATFGRNDGIYVFDDTGAIEDRLLYGDEDYPGSVRAREASAWVCADGLGAENPLLWSLSFEGDYQDSVTSLNGDVGNPGSFTGAPCGGIGTPFCVANANSTGAASELRADGSREAADNDVTLVASSLPTGSTGYLLVSANTGFSPNPGGSLGNLCLGAPIGRYVGPGQIGNSGAAGEIALTLDLTALPQPTGFVSAMPGETWYWQLWHRDSLGGQPVSNFTNGLAVNFE